MRKYVSVIICLYSLTNIAQDIDVFEQYYGRYSYTAIGNTLNPAENNIYGSFCEILPESSANLTLTPSQNVIAAYIYWAGSGFGDTTVTLNGTDIIADDTLTVEYDDPNRGLLTYFSCFKDITTFIQSTGSANYTLSNLDISDVLAANPGYCGNRTNFAGWSIAVIYEDDMLPLNQVSVYHGLEIINRNEQEINITIDNLNVLDNDGAKMGFLAWEGDNALNIEESLVFNGNTLESLPLNPGTNAFNGTNSFANSTTSYNMDLDVYDIENFISIGDDTATIQLTTGADLIIINNIITVLNSQLPDATVQIDDILVACDNNDIQVNYTVYNVNATELLPANTPIAFYADGILVETSFTEDDILIGDSETNSIVITLPENIPDVFNLTLVVDDDGTGNGIVQETNETNNDTSLQVTMLLLPEVTNLPNIESCDVGNNTATFDLTSNEHLLTIGTNQIEYYTTQNDAIQQTNAISIPTAYQNSVDPQTIFVRVDNTNCYQITSFNLTTTNCPPWIPNGFSPNGDGVNDEFEISGLLTIFENFELKIYNRYGTLIYKGGEKKGFWNGISNEGINNRGKLLPVGTYYYVLHLNDPNYEKPLVGWVYMNY
ncbi:MAG: gliding motility-associated C-terminal domain-containing protein [Flavobacteriaceae bacterium]